MKKLVIFNLETSNENQILRHTQEWILAFSKNYSEIQVFSTHVKPHGLPPEIKVKSYGGGSPANKFIAIIKLIRISMNIDKKNTVVFHHMNEKTAFLIGPLLRLRGIPQALWYSHSNNSLYLRIATFFMNSIYSPSMSTFPIRTKKLIETGHAIDCEKFYAITPFEDRKNEILIVGRISRIKRIDKLLESVADWSRIKIVLYGPIFDIEYHQEIVEMARTLEIDIEFCGEVLKEDLPKIYNQFKYFYSGNPKTLDKSTVEAVLCGCLVFSDQKNVMELLTQHNEYYSVPLKTQIKSIFGQTSTKNAEISINNREFATKIHCIQKTIDKISFNLEKI